MFNLCCFEVLVNRLDNIASLFRAFCVVYSVVGARAIDGLAFFFVSC